MEGEIAYFFVGGQAELSWNVSDLPSGFGLQGTLLRNGNTYPMTNTANGTALTMRTTATPLLSEGKYVFVMTLYKTSNNEIVDEESAEVIFKTPKTPVR